MISILHRYIAKTVITTTLLVILVVISLSFFINLLSEFRDIGIGYYGFSEALIHSILRVPFSFYQFFPMVALLGSVWGLGMLASHQELTVMRASGVSAKKIVQAVLLGTLGLIIIVTALGEWISPQANFLADKRKDSAQNGGQAVVTASGVWIHEGNEFFHIKQVIKRDHLEGVTRYQFDAYHHLLASYYAPIMEYQHHQWILHDVVQTNFNKDSTTSTHTAEMSWDLMLNPNLLTVGMAEPEEMSLAKLNSYSKHLIHNGLQATDFQFTFWKRVFQPLGTLVMIFLAIPFMLSAKRSVIIGRRILVAVLVGFLFYMLSVFLGQLSVVLQLSPCLAALLPILLFATLGYLLAIIITRLRNA